MEYLYIFLWYLSGCLASYLLWRQDVKDSSRFRPKRTCPSPIGILAGLSFAVTGTLGLISTTIALIIIWCMEDRGDSWWTRPVCRK